MLRRAELIGKASGVFNYGRALMVLNGEQKRAADTGQKYDKLKDIWGLTKKARCLMETVIREKRIQSRLTLRELAKALGEGFSPARLSLAERGIIKIPVHDELAIFEAIIRLAPLSEGRRRIVEVARDIDFAPFVADVREARYAGAHVGGIKSWRHSTI
jgi:hypothetical protein